MKTYDYSLQACLDTVKIEIERYKQDPIRLLGKYVLRAEQDVWFNETMITALKQYIKENNIKWNN